MHWTELSWRVAPKHAHIGLNRLLSTTRCCLVALALAPRLKSLRQKLRGLKLDLTAKDLEMSVMQQKYQTLVLANAVVDAVNTKDTGGIAASANSSTDGTNDTPGAATDADGPPGVSTDTDGTPGVSTDTDGTPGVSTDANGPGLATTSSTPATTASDSSELTFAFARTFASHSTRTSRSLSQKRSRCQQALVTILRPKHRSSGSMI